MLRRVLHLLVLAIATLAWFSPLRLAASEGNLHQELAQLKSRIGAKQRAGKTSEADLAREINQFSDLLTKYTGNAKKEDLAEVLYAKGEVYADIVKDAVMAQIIFDQLRFEYPNTMAAARAAEKLTAIQTAERNRRMRGTHARDPRGSSSPRTENTTSGRNVSR